MKFVRVNLPAMPNTGKILALLDQAVASGGSFLLGIILAAQLGLSGYGTFNIWWLGVLFALGLHQALVTQPMLSLFASREPETYLRQVEGFQWGITATAAISALAAAWIAPDSLLPWVILLGAAYLHQDFQRKARFVRRQYGKALRQDLLLYGVMLPGLWSLHYYWKPLDLKLVFIVMLGAYIFSIALGARRWAKQEIPAFRAILSVIKMHYHFSTWLLGASILQWFSGNFFLVAAAGVLGPVAVGALRMAQNVVGLCHVLFLYLENSMPVEAAQRYFEHGRVHLFRYLRRATWRMGAAVLLMLVILYAVSPWLIRHWYGAEYLEYHYVIGLYAVLYLAVFAAYPLRFALRTLEQTFPIFLGYAATALIGLTLAFPMVRALGMAGVMAGLMGCQLITLGIYLVALRRKQSLAFVLGWRKD